MRLLSRTVLWAILTLLLTNASALVFNTQTVEAEPGTIYIRPNGLVEGTDKIATVDNVTYIFKDYINDSVVVERSNILIDGAGFSVVGSSHFECGLNLTSVTNVTIINVYINNFVYGIELSSSSNNNITGNDIVGNDCGIVLKDSSNNTLCGNLVFSNNFVNLGGIWLDSSSNNSISGNNILANHQNGIRLAYSSNNNSVSGNNITNSWDGIRFDYSSNNIVSGNNITNNPHSGILLASSSNNSICHNNFNNTQQVSSDGISTNVWDDGYPSGGNYWSDYDGTDANHDGIGDTPYFIDANNTDHYPLMTQYMIPEFPSFLIPPLFMAATLLVATLCRRRRINTE